MNTIRHLPLHSALRSPCSDFNDETSGLANVEAATPRSPLVVGLVIVAAAFVLGVGAGALITFAIFSHFQN